MASQQNSPFFEVVKSPSARGHKRRKWPWIVLVIVLVLAGGGAGFYFWHNAQQKPTTNQAATKQYNTINDQIIKLDDQARSGSKVDDVMSGYDKLLSQATNNDDKYKVLMSKSLSAMAMGYPDKAIDPAEKAYQMKQNADSASALADAYAGAGNNNQAKKYYQLAIDYAKKANQSTDYYTQQMEALQ